MAPARPLIPATPVATLGEEGAALPPATVCFGRTRERTLTVATRGAALGNVNTQQSIRKQNGAKQGASGVTDTTSHSAVRISGTSGKETGPCVNEETNKKKKKKTHSQNGVKITIRHAN